VKAYKNLKEVKKACEEVASCAAGSDKFIYRCFPFLLQQLAEMNDKLANLGKRKPSAYNLFVAEQLKAGKSFKEAAELWNTRNG